MSPSIAPLALTSGEPAGVGPDLCVMLAARGYGAPVVVLGDRNLLRQRSERLGLALEQCEFAPGATVHDAPGRIWVMHLPLAAPANPGVPDPANGPSVLALLDRAVDGCLAGTFSAMVTAPVHKGVINDAGIPFTGHTEYLAQRTGVAHVVMMLEGGGLRVALATTHLALAEVPAAITREGLHKTLEVLEGDLRRRYGIARPRILVAGLNPHAGESGHLGREEIDVIGPVIEEMRAGGMDLVGPLPADTLFNPERLRGADCVLAMYHDQGLPVLKHACFGGGVNITLGLPIVRTSVDHGTALDLAGSARADPGSLQAAIATAQRLARA